MPDSESRRLTWFGTYTKDSVKTLAALERGMAKHLQRDLDQLAKDLLTMGAMVEDATNKAIQALVRRNKALGAGSRLGRPSHQRPRKPDRRECAQDPGPAPTRRCRSSFHHHRPQGEQRPRAHGRPRGQHRRARGNARGLGVGAAPGRVPQAGRSGGAHGARQLERAGRARRPARALGVHDRRRGRPYSPPTCTRPCRRS